MGSTFMGKVLFLGLATSAYQLFNFGGHTESHTREKNAQHDPPEGTKSQVNDEKSDSDLIKNLPGLDFDPGFRQFAGYLTVDERRRRRIFYWYVESQQDPESDPLVLWTNGGPGCSGMVGFGTEHGPFFISQDGTLSPNPFSWNKIANMLYIEQPSGVGFSYSERRSDYKTGDQQAASDNYEFILAFLEKYPALKRNDFYISSESYGGHYMPQLTREILKRDRDDKINFKGMMVGNPYVDPLSNTISQFDAFYSHGLLPWPHYHKWQKRCQDATDMMTPRCQAYMKALYEEIGDRINPYALDYPECTAHPSSYAVQTDTSDLRNRFRFSSQASQLMNATTMPYLIEGHKANANPPWLPSQDVFRPCAEFHLDDYLNRPDVMEALHARLVHTDKWTACSRILHYDWDDAAVPQISLYEDLLSDLERTNLHILVYSGDDDSVCSLAGTQTWIWDLGLKPRPSVLWQPWAVNNQTAGYVTKFQVPKHSSGSFTFATVHGAGHEVPLYRPMEAFQLFQNFLSGTW